MTTKLKTQPCHACEGSGKIPADDVGTVLREEREAIDITQGAVADVLNISQTYLRDLETNRRRWTNELVTSYQQALERLKNGD